MALSRSPPVVMLWLFLQSSIYLQGSNAETPSLWGKKAVFMAKACMWQLDPEVAVPALDELSVCVQLRFTLETVWTAFAYKAPGGGLDVELGLEGDSSRITVVLFGSPVFLNRNLSSFDWHSLCLTWSNTNGRLRIYVNGTRARTANLSYFASRRLAANGTLTLGVPHSVDEKGVVRREDGRSLMGDIGLFRMWGRERAAEDLSHLGCVEGDVVRWDTRHWSHLLPNSCPPQADQSLRCDWSSYKIQMLTYVANISAKTNISLEYITGHWMESIFSQNISVQNILLPPPRPPCRASNYLSALYIQRRPENSIRLGNLTFDDCFFSEVYVSVSPESSVDRVQAYITERLGAKFSYGSLTLMADIHRLSIQPVEPFHAMTKPPPAGSDSPAPASTDTTTEDTKPTQRFPPSPTNASTANTPLDNDTLYTRDVFFRVNLTIAYSGKLMDAPYFIWSWLNECLALNKMKMLNFRIMGKAIRDVEKYGGQTFSHGVNKVYDCAFHVQHYMSGNVTELALLIHDSLDKGFRNDTLFIQTRQQEITHIVPKSCPEESLTTIYGVYLWAETFPEEVQVMRCQKPESNRAYRLCMLDIVTDMTSWEEPNMASCMPLMNISDLNDLTVTADNAAEVVQMIQDLINIALGPASGGDGELSVSDMVTLVGKLDDVVDVSVVTSVICQEIVRVISDMLISKTDMHSVANMVINLTERIGDKAVLSEDSFNMATPALALSMINVHPDSFRGISFCVSNFSAGTIPEIVVNQSFGDTMPGTVAGISLPPSLQTLLVADRNKTRIQFQFYGIQDLFNDMDMSVGAKGNWTLTSYVISASISNSTVRDLSQEMVSVTLGHDRAEEHQKVMCVFWDFSENDGDGGWNNQGCETRVISPHQTRCLCDHLTSFAVLLDIGRANISQRDSEILTVISYLGCGISSIFLGITLITYLAFGKLRRDYPSKILINLSAALLALNLLYLINTWLSSFPGDILCMATGALLHYTLLASFTWMGLEALHMYFALVKVFNIYVPSYILKFCAVGWGVPLVIVGLVLATDIDAYGNMFAEEDNTSESFCWIRSDVYFYVTVAAFILLVLVGNVVVFVVVLIQLRRMQANKYPAAGDPSGGTTMRDLRAAASLTVLLGLTWLLGFLAVGPGRIVLLYMFCIFNCLQGFFVFVFHCLMKENVRKQWRIQFSFGSFKHNDSSDWSRTWTASGRPKKKKKQAAYSQSMGSVGTSSIIKVSHSSSSAESGPGCHQRS